ncbi:hypothetical protein NC315_27195 [Streptomyces sp. G2]|uniref:hypothetical protein n=1 Tax=Streptomyces TaxID=1883 RepID=UPI0020308289|nr:hypothetical protein [Streptomyces sp. G2]MCM1949032.1 hypothetical protein [Streptomyces sp. G2]
MEIAKSLAAVGLTRSPYPILWGIGRITTGHLAHRVDRKPLIVTGTPGRASLVPVLALINRPWRAGLPSAVIQGLGTASVHSTLIASDHVPPPVGPTPWARRQELSWPTDPV